MVSVRIVLQYASWCLNNDQQNEEEVTVSDFWGKVIDGIVASALLSWIACSGKSQLLYHDTQAALEEADSGRNEAFHNQHEFASHVNEPPWNQMTATPASILTVTL